MYTTASGKNTENALRAKKITWDWKDFRFWFYAIRLSCGQNYCYWKHFLCSAQELAFCKFIFQWPFYPIGISWGLVLFMQDKKMVFDDSILIFWNPWFEIWTSILYHTIIWKIIRMYYTDWMYQIVYFITGTKYSEGNGQGLIFVSKLMHKDGKMNHIQEVKMKRQLCIDFISWFRNWWWVFFLTKRDLVYCITER